MGQTRQSGVVKCYSRGKAHYKNNCPNGSGARKCFKCWKEGHIVIDCTSVEGSGSQPQRFGLSQPRGGSRPHAVGRVYVMTGSEAVGSGNLIISSCLLYGKICCVLFDLGATDSFVYEECVEKLGLLVGKL